MNRIKTIILISLLSNLCLTQIKAQVSFGESVLINNDWKFILKDEPKALQADYNDHRWQKVDLPYDWSVKQQLSPTLASCQGYLPGGIGWYRKKLIIPEEKQGEKVFLYFEGVYNRSEVYINGQLLGKRPNGYISFMYDVTPYIQYGKENMIAVRADHSRSADSRWYTGSGIYRDVYVIYSNPVHIDQWGVYTYPKTVTAKQGVLSIEVNVKNENASTSKLTVKNELVSPDGKIVAQSSGKLDVTANAIGKYSNELKVNVPKLWSLNFPHLYTLNTTIIQDGKIIDKTSTKTGFRSFTFDPNKGFALNREWLKIKGVCLHHDAGVLGSAVPKEVWKRRLQNLKEIGVNAIRTSHNPQAPELYDLCDELGLLVLNEMYDEWEFPKRKWLEGWNVGTPGFEGNFDYFEEWGEKDLADFVRRDRNHISVFAWSIGNEVDYPNDPYSHPVLDGGEDTGFTQAIFGGYKKDAPDAMRLGTIAKKLVAVVKQYDKSRPTTAGLAGVAMSNQTEYPGALDIAGYNYTESLYDKDHQSYPNRVIYGSENRHELNAWKQTRDKEYVFGQFLWTGIDYLGESGKWPSRGFYSGLLDFGGFIKPRGYFRQSLWSDKPMAYLGTYPTPGKGAKSQMKDVWSQLDAENEGANYEEKTPSMDAWPIWNYEEGQSIRVVCYTNAAKAKLLLDGREVGQTKEYDDNTGIIYWDIPYKAGKLEVIGMDKSGNQVSTYQIQSSKAPYALKIISAEKAISKDRGVAQIVMQIVDENGIPVMLSDNEVTCHIAGPAKLLGLEASNNEDMSDYTDNKHRVYHGRILAYIQATGKEGEIKVRFSAPWLKDEVLKILVQ
ncbi:glycoside hydrolase family 2 protein [Bacteroides ovatus]|uniref:Glycoside hydrolase family 2 protein n=1 Tax=Bacteroides ovatus TaxID=28116 RepID=A0A7J4Y2G2_BACOV|nr:glycoside hydrolase family 2 protein [Bacteroides ovatus]KAA4634125.1 glycoside hydrolase family 2 protein [Bacteroides ovatus]KAA4675183.1 glycoside hydrolase family 2 protein [Bacteroides ovatus]KAA4677903.1 glycoside hydrolase family 2 protein [Bacteroides ovatus]